MRVRNERKSDSVVLRLVIATALNYWLGPSKERCNNYCAYSSPQAVLAKAICALQ